MSIVKRRLKVKGYHIAEGPLKIKLVSGRASLTGKRLLEGEDAVIPLAKATLLEVEGEAELEVMGGGTLSQIEESTIPREWQSFIDNLASRGEGVVFVLGSVDSGKTFFITYTANKLLEAGAKVSVIDGDIGQSDVGPPTAIGLGYLERQVVFLEEVGLASAYFVGSTTPAGHLLPMVVGTAKLIHEARAHGGIVLVDTPGMVYGGPARALQIYCIEATKPDMVVALQRERELEHLLKQLKALEVEVARLPASPYVRLRDRKDRKFLRERAFHNYFTRRGTAKLTLSLDRVAIIGSFLGTGERAPAEITRAVQSATGSSVEYCEISQDAIVVVLSDKQPIRNAYLKLRNIFRDRTVKVIRKGFEKGLVAGLIGEKSTCLDIGVLQAIDFHRGEIVLISPWKTPEAVKAVKIGCVKLDESFREVERLEPGFL